MAESAIPVDLFNPGQVFACLGFMEAAIALEGDARAGFDWSPPAPHFCLHVPGAARPVEAVLAFLAEASVEAMAPAGSELDTAKWRVVTRSLPNGAPYPIPMPSSPATLPALLTDGRRSVTIAHWGDGTKRDNVKFWAGAGGFPGVGLLRDALDLARNQLDGAHLDPFSVAAAQSSSFRFDWRRDYIPIDAGFSLNEHGNVQPQGFPLVEILAAIGLTHARPSRVTKLLYHYGVVGRASDVDPAALTQLPPPLLRAALGGSLAAPFPSRRFAMRLGWPGQENQARCITTVTEETT